MTNRSVVRDEPVKILVEDGNVAIAVPDGADLVLSPNAAEETSDRLWKGAMAARGQQRLADSRE